MYFLETMKILGKLEKNIHKDKTGVQVPKLKATEVCTMHIVKIRGLFTFLPKIHFGK